jgi:gamma-D-glutamyl-L-lysine dipeptidyl-peptidase
MKFLLPFIFIFLVSGCRPAKVPFNIQNGVDSIAKAYVPDTREGLCEVSLSMHNGKMIKLKGETNLPEAKSEILKYILNSGFEVSDSLSVIPDTLFIKKPWGLVSVSVCNIKRSPSHPSELLSQAIMGTPVKILKIKGSWIMIQTPDYYIGWVNNSSIEELSEAEINKWKNTERIIFLKKSGDILSQSGNDLIVSDIVSGAILEAKSEKDGYFEVVLPDGRTGRLKNTDATGFKQWSSTVCPDINKFILFSKSLLGSPYLWGGTSIKALDCSGFVKTIYFTGGVILARDASLQNLHGTKISYSSAYETLLPGDLIMFGSMRDGKERITHVGMYIGDTEVIHCSGMVRINSLDSTRTNFSNYLKDTMMGVRRVIGTVSMKGVEHIANHSWYLIKDNQNK